MSDIEKVEYKPVSVRDLLVEMKDLSELMIDLAYSAALFHSKELAEEVLELEKRVDTLTYILDMNAMLAARDAGDAESLGESLNQSFRSTVNRIDEDTLLT